MTPSTKDSLTSFLYDLKGPLVEMANSRGPFYEAIRRDIQESLRRDQANLDAMTPRARKVELTRRRIARCEQRFREAMDFSPCGCRDEW